MARCGKNKNQKIAGAFPNQSNPNNSSSQNTTSNNAYNLNNALAALEMYKKMNQSITQILGIDVVIFRSIPQDRSKDVIFQEYTLSNVEDCPYNIKVVVPSGQMPDSKFNFDLMGLEYEVPFEIQIDINYWQSIVGENTAPQRGDIIYIPMNNRLYEIQSMYVLRGFMDQETTFKCNLSKYIPNKARRESPNLAATVDNYTVSETELFGEEIKDRVEDATDNKQFSAYNSTERDLYKELDINVKVVEQNLIANKTIFARTYYDLSQSKFYNAINYKNVNDVIKTNEDRGLSIWCKFNQSKEPKYKILSITQTNKYGSNYIIKIDNVKANLMPESYINIKRQNSFGFFAKIINTFNSNKGVYYVYIDPIVIEHLNFIYPDWINVKTYSCYSSTLTTLINNNYNDLGYNISIIGNQFVILSINGKQYISICENEIPYNEWVGITCNLKNSEGIFETYIRNINSTYVNGDKLTLLSKTKIEFIPEEIVGSEYNIQKTTTNITNIRLYKEEIPEKDQENDLLTYNIKWSNKSIILDSADIIIKTPYAGQPR